MCHGGLSDFDTEDISSRGVVALSATPPFWVVNGDEGQKQESVRDNLGPL